MDCKGCPVAGFVGTCHKGLLIYFYEYVNEAAMAPTSKGPAGAPPEKNFFAPVIKDYIHKQSFVTGAKKILLGFMGFLWNFYGGFMEFL